jgi:hypothetical protein
MYMKTYRISAEINANNEGEALELMADEIGKNMGDLTTVFKAEAIWADAPSN